MNNYKEILYVKKSFVSTYYCSLIFEHINRKLFFPINYYINRNKIIEKLTKNILQNNLKYSKIKQQLYLF